MNAPAHPRSVELTQLLAARDARAARHAAARERYSLPLVSLTLVSPGPVKDGLQQRHVMREALKALDACLSRESRPIVEREVYWLPTGPEALYVVNAEAAHLKAALVELENRHALGRLWDLDVIGAGGPVSRQSLGMPARPCLLCGEAAHACARSQRHTLPSLLAAIEERIDAFDRRATAR
ncbi:citrate lyase holo-[acyl-carrier protein] synthase [Paludibacterium yongneupense]|uniref:citrate lyase holo-[acyl-carrier protein] synthase n=1 Tax=Paludibacterium yongneupense TaxID=400061 RepID=UPI0003FF9E78|nr:citrate lyase holo-[acyl-carrier protein] synthase [Paludibacterium yongneupense]